MSALSAPPAVRDGVLFRFGLFLVRNAKIVLVLGGLALIVFGAIGAGAFGKLEGGGFEDPGSDSARAAAIANAHFPSAPNLVLVVRPTDGRLDSPATAAAGVALTDSLAQQSGVTIAASYFRTAVPALAATDRSSGLILIVLAGDRGQADSRAADLTQRFSGDQHGVQVLFGGSAAVNNDINGHVSSSLVLAESIAVPITLVLLLVVFGSVVAALLPLLIGVVAIAGTFFELSLLASTTDVSIFAINLTTALGLGLGIDYGLLLVARFREHLAGGADVDVAVARTVATAGRTILFSAAAVLVALSTLTLFPLYFLSSFGYAGMGVVLIAATSALLLMPAVLALLGRRVDAGKLPFAGTARGSASRFWGRAASAVFRHPVRTAGPVLLVMLIAATPLLGITFALPDQSVLPVEAMSRQVSTTLSQQYPAQSTAVLTLVSTGPVSTRAAQDAAAVVGRVHGVVTVTVATAAGADGDVPTASPASPASPALPAYQRLTVQTDVLAGSQQATTTVEAVRAAAVGTAAAGFLLGGPDASLTDTLAGIGRPLPAVLVIIVLSTFILLFLFTGSVVQPIRALVVNALSLSASVGVVTWIFQDGHLLALFGATVRPMDASMTVLLLCITFGLSMDYEVFLASRITELHFAGADLQTAVTQGLARTGRIVTSAALLLSVSFFAFATSSVSMLQLFGFGAGLAVLVDATLVRGVLVPAAMRLLGGANFWAPRWLRKIHARVGLAEG